MKAIMVMFDSLNRNYLSSYGCRWTHTPNFERLAKRAVTFDTCYVGSLPCMPARRELHTGRYNFLHRSWGPLEPFDDSVPEILKKNGVYTHLISDHQHYWEDGGCTYHTRYSSWEISRGQEGDCWKVTPESINWNNAYEKRKSKKTFLGEKQRKQDSVNRKFIEQKGTLPQRVTFEAGLDFIEKNHAIDSWFLQIETFDPHEPFFAEQKYRQLYFKNMEEGEDWPPYYYTNGNVEKVENYKKKYAALLSMCDESLGKVLDMMDKYHMWDDTMLIVNTDHGFLLGEHEWWGKNIMPVYEEIARIPLFVYDPVSKLSGVRRKELVQTIDIPATLLEFFDINLPETMQGKSLLSVIREDKKIREYALFGFFGAHVNVTDGKWVYMKAPKVSKDYDGCENLYEYTLMPTHMREMFSKEELQKANLVMPLEFTKDCPVLKIPARQRITDAVNYGTKLYYIENDQNQKAVKHSAEEVRMAKAMMTLLKESNCPKEIYERLGFKLGGNIEKELLENLKKDESEEKIPESLGRYVWDESASNMFRCVMKFLKPSERTKGLKKLEDICLKTVKRRVDCNVIKQWIFEIASGDEREEVMYFALLNSRTE